MILAQTVMRHMYNDRKRVTNSVDELIYSHQEVKKKLIKNRFESFQVYLSALHDEGLACLVTTLATQRRLQLVHERLRCAQRSVEKYKQFIDALERYGNTDESVLDALGLKQKLLRQSIQ